LSFTPSPPPLHRQHIVDLGLVDAQAAKNENLGFIRLFLKITPVSPDDVAVAPTSGRDKQKNANTKLWNSVLTVTLLEGSNLPAMDQNGGCGLGEGGLGPCKVLRGQTPIPQKVRDLGNCPHENCARQ
jgi:hypothetical protein